MHKLQNNSMFDLTSNLSSTATVHDLLNSGEYPQDPLRAQWKTNQSASI